MDENHVVQRALNESERLRGDGWSQPVYDVLERLLAVSYETEKRRREQENGKERVEETVCRLRTEPEHIVRPQLLRGL
jgi:hypothetical protein